MIKKDLKDINKEIVISHEESRLKQFGSIITSFNEKFKEFKCELEYEFVRLDKKNGVINGELQEKDLRLGYTSYLLIYIKKDGCMLTLRDDDEGVLQVIENIANISKEFFKTYVYMIDDSKEVIDELNEYLDFVTLGNIKKVEK